jgi:hypothetical protein
MRSLIWAHKSKNWPTLVKALILKKKRVPKKISSSTIPIMYGVAHA